MPGMLVELLAVAELLAQPRTDVQPVARVQAEVAVVDTACAHRIAAAARCLALCSPPSVTGRIWAACRTGRIFEPVMAHLRS